MKLWQATFVVSVEQDGARRMSDRELVGLLEEHRARLKLWLDAYAVERACGGVDTSLKFGDVSIGLRQFAE